MKPKRFKKNQYQIDALQAAVLLWHLRTATENNDADHTVDQLTFFLKRAMTTVPKEILESGLYSCNMMDESQQFWHPQGKMFTTFVGEILPKDERFSRYYNYIEKRKSEYKTAKREEEVGKDS